MRRISSGDTIDVAVGDRFELVLQELGATGYLFEPVCIPTEVEIGRPCRASPGASLGASNLVRFELVARAQGHVTVRFDRKAPFDPSPAEIASVEIRIHGN